MSASVSNDSYYWVTVSGPDVYWGSDDLPLTRTSVSFNDNGKAEGTLQSGQDYVAEVFIFNKGEDYAHQSCAFTQP